MDSRPFPWGWLIAAGVAYLLLTGKVGNFGPADPSSPSAAAVDTVNATPGVKAAIVGPTATQDAAYFASIFAAAADRTLSDGMSVSPVLRTQYDAEKFLGLLGNVATTGKTKGKYPAFKPALLATFNAQFPPGQIATFGPAERAKLAAIFTSYQAAMESI